MNFQDSVLKKLLLLMIGLFTILAFLLDKNSLLGFISLQFKPARLINDFMEVAGVGPALLNSACVGLIGVLLVRLTKIDFSGPIYAAIFTIMGFGLFGKTPLNIFPIILGVFFAAKVARKPFKQYLIIALFGTALGPIVSLIAFEFGFSLIGSILVSILAGVITGFVLPGLAISMLHLHQGYNLYNMGLTCGFFGIFAASVFVAGGHDFQSQLQWHNGNPFYLVMLIPIVSIVLIISGFLIGKKRSIKNFLAIQKLSGRLPTDFMDSESLDGTLINSGIIGLLGSLYIYLIGGDFNGPVIGGLMTVMGFGAFGTNLRNSWPVVLGVFISTLVFGHSLTEPGPILAIIFVTTLGPLAGEFGPVIGILAGITHFVMVMRTGSWHGAINLYNNGFAGGLTATLFIAMIQWFRNNVLKDSNFHFRK